MRELIKKAVYCYYHLTKNFINDVSHSLVKFGVLAKLVEMTGFFAEKKYTQMVLEMIELSLHEISEDMIKSSIVPYLIYLANLGFELGDKSNVIPARQVKLQAYRVIRCML